MKNLELKDSLFSQIKEKTLAHLRSLSNQEVIVPINGCKNISVKNLIIEIEKETEIGIKYMIVWVDTISSIVYSRRR